MFVEREMDNQNEMLRVWHMVQELGEQLSHNQKIVVSLKSQAGQVKVRFCIVFRQGFVLISAGDRL